jgi:peptidoglycan hydrolase-like amidase
MRNSIFEMEERRLEAKRSLRPCSFKRKYQIEQIKIFTKVWICWFKQERKFGMFRSWQVEAEGLTGDAAERKSEFESRSKSWTWKRNGSALAIRGLL